MTINNFSPVFAANNQRFREIDFNLHKINKQIYENSKKLSETKINTERNSYLLECAKWYYTN